MKKIPNFLFFLGLLLPNLGCDPIEKEYTTWNVYGGSKENIRYSNLREIDTSNVIHLEKLGSLERKIMINTRKFKSIPSSLTKSYSEFLPSLNCLL